MISDLVLVPPKDRLWELIDQSLPENATGKVLSLDSLPIHSGQGTSLLLSCEQLSGITLRNEDHRSLA